MPPFSTRLFNTRYAYPSILFLLFALLLGMSRAWEGVLDGDSMWYTILARGVVESGNWVVLSYRGEPWFDHPPLAIWILAILFHLFGSSVYVAKLMNTLSLFGVLFFTYKIGKTLKNEVTGLLAAVALIFTPHIIQLSGRIKLDMPLIFFSTLAIYTALKATTDSRKYYWVFGVATGAAILTKGVVGFAPLAVVFVSLVILRRWGDIFSLHFIGSLFALVIIPFSWVLAVISKLGTSPFVHYWRDHVLNAAVLGKGEANLPGFWYFSKIVLTHGIPWTLIALIGIYFLVRRWSKVGIDNTIFLVSWVVIIYLGYSIPKFKYAYYILPIYPPLAILSAITLSKYFTKAKAKDRIINYSYYSLGLIAFVITVFPITVRLERSEGVVPLIPVISEKYTMNKGLTVGVLDFQRMEENNTYQLIALNIDQKIKVKRIDTKELLSNLDTNDLVLLPNDSWERVRSEAKAYREIAFSDKYTLLMNIKNEVYSK